MNRSIKSLLVALGIAALFSALSFGIVFAEEGGDDGKKSQAVTEEEKQAHYEPSRTAFAEALGVTLEELDAAFQQVALGRVDAAVEAGRIDEQKAAELRTAIESGELAGKRFGRGFKGSGEALAEELGVTADDLVAASKQIALDRVDDAVEAGKITEEEGTEIRANIESGQGVERGRGQHDFGKRGAREHHGSWNKNKDGHSPTEKTATAE